MLSGRLPHSIGAYDNASEFPSSIPTLAHYLRHAGYRTILAGKMHFIGADQLHGYEERLTTDIYPADFAWTPDWLKGPEHRPTGVSMRPVLEAGPCLRSLQIDYDEEVAYKAEQCLYDLARRPEAEKQAFFLTVSYTHPHPPFVAPQRYWDLYNTADIPLPQVPEIPYESLDPHSQWLYIAHAQNLYTVNSAQVQHARHAYYAMVSYTDALIGRVLSALHDTGLDKDTIVLFCGDHGEMLGERGMWFKQTFYEQSVRVPFMLRLPKELAPAAAFESPKRIDTPMSLVDVLPSLIELSGQTLADTLVGKVHGQSLLPLLRGEQRPDAQVIAEYSSEGVCAPSRMLRTERHKLIITHGLPPLLFDLLHDPLELVNLAEKAEYQTLLADLYARLTSDWDPKTMHERILSSQKERLFLAALGQKNNWAYQPFVDESTRFIRGSGSAGPTSVKARARFPYVEPVKADKK
jgi:choline-sulfatase